MIAFKEDKDPNESEKMLKKLEKLLLQIYGDPFEIPTFEEVNLSELLEIVYQKLYLEDNKYINISIQRENNNLLKYKIEKTK